MENRRMMKEFAPGTEIYKQFDAGFFWGEIAPEEPLDDGMTKYYLVIYEDGDREHLTAAELRPLVEAARKKRQGNSSAPEAVEEEDNDNDTATARRSSRKRIATTINVDGHIVKKINNYRVVGLGYKYGEAKDTGKKKYSRKKVVKKAPTTLAPRTVSPEEKQRLEQRDYVSKNIREKEGSRNSFLRQHLEVLKPFVVDKVRQGLKAHPIQTPNTTKINMQPDIINASLRDYQMASLQWLSDMYEQNVSAILGDEMGLGKTLQTISLVALLKEQKQLKGPSLVVCPLSVLYSWCAEIEKFAPSLKFFRMHSTEALGLSNVKLYQYDIIITTYEMITADAFAHQWKKQYFNLLVLDEGHKIKNSETQVSVALRKIHSEFRLILTGTPLANDLVELWSLLNFLLPDVFTDSQPFADAFDLTQNKVDRNALENAHQLLQIFMLRRLKSTVEKMMPPKIETKIICPLSNTQIWWYKALLMKDISLIIGDTKSKTKAKMLTNLIMQLRKCCIHPFLFPGTEDIDSTSLEDLIAASGKLAVLDKLLLSLYAKGHRVVLFSQFTSVLDILDDYCNMRGWNYCRFDGSTSRAKRNFVINSFNASGSRKFIFLMSTRSGGMGLNLQTADTCILFDADWNPQVDIQAMARVHRVGQTKVVHVYRLVTQGTVEERMIERAEKKLFLDRMVTKDSDATMEIDEAGAMHTLKFGCSAIFGDKDNSLPSIEDIEIITDRNRTQDFSMEKLKGGTGTSVDSYDATKAFHKTTDFGGIDFLKLREQAKKQNPKDMYEISQAWKKREKKNRIKMVTLAGSGYGSTAIPVLNANDYDLESGEKSVFQRELKGSAVVCEKKNTRVSIENLSLCQSCGDGGFLIMCPFCPVSLHAECAGVSKKEFYCCSHHHCSVCNKSASNVGGFIYPCNSCCACYCEDHIPRDSTILETNERMENLGFTIKNGVYIHCSKECELYATRELGYIPPDRLGKEPSPPILDVSFNFGGVVDDSLAVPGEVAQCVRGTHSQAGSDGRSAVETASNSFPECNALNTRVISGEGKEEKTAQHRPRFRDSPHNLMDSAAPEKAPPLASASIFSGTGLGHWVPPARERTSLTETFTFFSRSSKKEHRIPPPVVVDLTQSCEECRENLKPTACSKQG